MAFRAQGTLGSVAAGDPRAAAAGLRALEEGGNAIDAVLAAAAVQWVVMPDMCGPGGDLFAIVSDLDRMVAINASGPAPAAGVHPAAADGAAATVPGALAGVEALIALGAKLPVSLALDRAADLAERGFVVAPMLAAHVNRLPPGAFRASLLNQLGAGSAGDIARWPILAATLRQLALEGAAAFASPGGPGILGRRATAEWSENGCLIAPDDLASAEVSCERPMMVRVGEWQVGLQPPVSQGVVTGIALQLLGVDGLKELAAGTEWGIHTGIEAIKEAFAVGLAAARDGGRDEAEQLLGSGTPSADHSRIGPLARTGMQVPRSDTTHAAAADSDGRVVTLLHSLYNPFGSQTVSPSTGILLNDRGRCFGDSPGNEPLAGRRARHTLANIVGVHENGTRLALGTPGANAQVQTGLQVLARVLTSDPLEWGAALDAPRWTFHGGLDVALENRFPVGICQGLEGRGHVLVSRPDWDWLTGAVGLAAAIPGRGVLAYQDTRRDGGALAV